MLRAVGHRHPEPGQAPFASLTLDHAARHLRRKRLDLPTGDAVLVDLPEAIALADGDALVLDDGRLVGIVAAPEALYAVTGRNARHLTEIAWHIGNRHLPAQIEAARILVARDPVIRTMLEGLGGVVAEVTEPFHPARGAYHGHGHGHGHP